MPQQSILGRKNARVLSSTSDSECEIYYLLPKAFGRLMDPVLVTLERGARTPEDPSTKERSLVLLCKGRSPSGWMPNPTSCQGRLLLL